MTQIPFIIIYDAEVRQHMKQIPKKYHSLIQKAIEEQLTYTPDLETRNRKPLRRPSLLGASWELRCGTDNRFRVLYSTNIERGEVYILAIGTKQGNQLFIGDKELEL